MRVDVVTIFPDYLAPLELSLIGKARRDGLLDVRVHDLRDFARDRHRTVDDTPYGGGAGMVMKPGPWAEALRRLTVGVPVAVARTVFYFSLGATLAGGERVYAYPADSLGWDVTPVSLGDYVLNGGEVAVLAMVEAIARLIPGVVGNEESLVEESHEGGLLEYPVYTKPARWATEDSVYAVPPVLLSGNHAAIAAWRQEQRLARTAVSAGDLVVAAATPADAPELLVLQRACFVREIEAHGNDRFPALTEELPDVVAGLGKWRTLTARAGGRLVGAARGRLSDATTWEVSRVMVAPDLVGRGLGRRLLAEVEAIAPGEATAYRLLVAAGAARTRRLYKKAGYRELPGAAEVEGTVAMGKRRAAPAG